MKNEPPYKDVDIYMRKKLPSLVLLYHKCPSVFILKY